MFVYVVHFIRFNYQIMYADYHATKKGERRNHEKPIWGFDNYSEEIKNNFMNSGYCNTMEMKI